jgi:hypothetical protein
MCLATSVREALIRGFDVAVDPEATGACALEHPVLGQQSANQVRDAALLHVVHMGATIVGHAQASAAELATAERRA